MNRGGLIAFLLATAPVLGAPKPTTPIPVAQRKHWAFIPPRQAQPPEVKAAGRVRNEIDRFVLARLEAKGLSLSPEADRRTLMRRVFYDLIGLPPTPAEMAMVLNDTKPGAYERLVDRLLASRHYGERWGRHWLDAVGYVDNRLFDGDLGTIYPNEGMWRYRDYVIASLNTDKPYDQFLREQLAGDEMCDWRAAKSFTPAIRDQLVATGFLRNIEDVTSEAQYGEKERYDVLYDLMSMVSTSIMGLTLECARCHNHKFDPLTQHDYFSFMAFFEPALNTKNWLKPQQRWLADVAPVHRKAIEQHNHEVNKKIEGLKKQLTAAGKAKDKPKTDELKKQIAALEKTRRTHGKIQALWDVGPQRASHIFLRGNFKTPAQRISASFPGVLSTVADTQLLPAQPGPVEGTGLRTALAKWLTHPSHPLTARVIVNRVWHHHFGRGIVDTPGNLGRSGGRPTHPQLLDWLAVDFARNGWCLKRLHRQILLSAIYRQQSRRRQAAHEIDSENKLLWRMNLRRLEAEIVRDAVLAASGQLDRQAGGPPVMISKPPNGYSRADTHRRSVYLFARRVYPLKFLETFDVPIMSINCTQRRHSVSVLQSFAFLNGPFVNKQADKLAEAVAAKKTNAIESIFQRTLSRGSTQAEASECAVFLKAQTATYIAEDTPEPKAARRALRDLCHLLLTTNEFLYVD